MAKSIRSKSKRKNRTEFRNTIGTVRDRWIYKDLKVLLDAAKANMDIVQAKLQQCVNSGRDDTQQTADDDIEMRNTTEGKDSSKIPAKKSSTTKLAVSKMERQYGDKTSRKLAEKRQKERGRGRSRGTSLDGRKQRSSSKKRSGKKLAVIS
eukprot:scaffold4066_cov63-Cyclotella_meneghiniana.AAC.1